MLQEKKTILLIEPRTELREAYTDYLTTRGNYKIIQDGTGLSIEDIYRTEKFDIVITNMTLNKTSGADVIKKIKAIAPHVKTVGMSMFFHKTYANELKEIGADAYTLKSINPNELLKILQDVVIGEKYFVSE